MNDATPVQGWRELLLALPEFFLTDVVIDVHDELIADVEPPRRLGVPAVWADRAAPCCPRPALAHRAPPAGGWARLPGAVAQAAAVV